MNAQLCQLGVKLKSEKKNYKWNQMNCGLLLLKAFVPPSGTCNCDWNWGNCSPGLSS